MAFAHMDGSAAHALTHGLEHPFVGFDHVLAMVAVGLWAVQLGGRALWMVPASFVTAMAIGGAMGVNGVALVGAETGIAMSVLMLGLFILATVRMPVWAGSLIAGLFAICHGHAHGTEMPVDASALVYALGFMVSTALLHGAGIAAGSLTGKYADTRLVRLAGAAVMMIGAFLWLGPV